MPLPFKFEFKARGPQPKRLRSFSARCCLPYLPIPAPCSWAFLAFHLLHVKPLKCWSLGPGKPFSVPLPFVALLKFSVIYLFIQILYSLFDSQLHGRRCSVCSSNFYTLSTQCTAQNLVDAQKGTVCMCVYIYMQICTHICIHIYTHIIGTCTYTHKYS